MQQEIQATVAEKLALFEQLEAAKQLASKMKAAKGKISQQVQQELQAAVAEKLALSEQLEADRRLCSELEAAKNESSQLMLNWPQS